MPLSRSGGGGGGGGEGGTATGGWHLLFVVFDDADGAEVSRELGLRGAGRDALYVDHVRIRQVEGHGVRVVRLRRTTVLSWAGVRNPSWAQRRTEQYGCARISLPILPLTMMQAPPIAILACGACTSKVPGQPDLPRRTSLVMSS